MPARSPDTVITLRKAQPADYYFAIQKIVPAAFKRPNEVRLVEALRLTGEALIETSAMDKEATILAHIVASSITLDHTPEPLPQSLGGLRRYQCAVSDNARESAES